jgi:hypothetical protein
MGGDSKRPRPRGLKMPCGFPPAVTNKSLPTFNQTRTWYSRPAATAGSQALTSSSKVTRYRSPMMWCSGESPPRSRASGMNGGSSSRAMVAFAVPMGAGERKCSPLRPSTCLRTPRATPLARRRTDSGGTVDASGGSTFSAGVRRWSYAESARSGGVFCSR